MDDATPAAPRVLVVDDEHSVRTTLAANLELDGFVVVEAESAERALELLETRTFDLVLSDIRMPGLSGVELLQRIRLRDPELPVILMTAFAREHLVREAMRAGVFTVLAKPFDLALAMTTLQRALSRPLVLVVDDAAPLARTLADGLVRAGLRAQAEFDAAGCLRALAEHTVDVCVIDLVMPGLDGARLIERIRELEPSIVIIAVSGHDVPELVRQAARAGVFAFRQKPFDPGDLLELVARARSHLPRPRAV